MGTKSQLGLAVALMLLGVASIALGDTAGKLLGGVFGVAPFFIAWSRFAFGAALIAPLVNWKSFRIEFLFDWRVVLRALLIVGGIVCILTALKTTSLATVFGAFFIGPIVAYFLGALILKESITREKTLLIIIGFGGVLLVTRPSLEMDAGVIFALLAGVFYGSFVVATKWLVKVAQPLEMLFSQLIIGTVILLPFGLWTTPELSWPLVSIVLASAGFSLLGNFFLILATQRAAASSLAPILYFQLIFVAGLGYFVFDDIPDATTIGGLIILVFSGIGSLFFVGKNRIQ